MTFVRKRLSWLVAAAALLTTTARAEAPGQTACIDANEKAQVLVHSAKWSQARTQLLLCTDDACPSLVRSDCAKLLGELAWKMPRVLVVVRDESGADLRGASVEVDGNGAAPVAGTPIDIDPGEHTLKIAHPDHIAVEQSVVMREGEGVRKLEVTLRKRPISVPIQRGFVNAPAWAVTGVGFAAAAVFAGFAIAGKVTETDRAGTCSPYCTDEELAPIRRDFLVADIALGVTVAAAVTATILFLVLHPTKRPGIAMAF